jgi:hypothetical protein
MHTYKTLFFNIYIYIYIIIRSKDTRIIPARDVYKGSRTSLTREYGGTGNNPNRHKAHSNYLSIIQYNKIKYNKDRTPKQTQGNKFIGTKVLTTS